MTSRAVRTVAAIAIATLGAARVRAQQASSPFTITEESPLADSVIARYYVAIGGHDALIAITTRRMNGAYVEGKLHATTDIVWRRPESRRVNLHAPGFDYSEGFDGSTWEYNHLSKKAVRDTGAAEAAGRRGAEFDESFVDYRAKGYRVTICGSGSLAGRRVTGIRVTLADGWAKEYFFDDASHLIVGLVKAMPLHATGPEVRSVSLYSDWGRVCGVLQAHTFVETDQRDGREMNRLHWEAIACDVPVSDAELAMPEAGAP